MFVLRTARRGFVGHVRAAAAATLRQLHEHSQLNFNFPAPSCSSTHSKAANKHRDNFTHFTSVQIESRRVCACLRCVLYIVEARYLFYSICFFIRVKSSLRAAHYLKLLSKLSSCLVVLL